MPLIRRDPPPPGQPDPLPGLADPDPDRRWRAARATAGQPASIAALAAALAHEADRRVREAILASLAAMPDGGGLDPILAQLRSDDAALRTAALDALRAAPAALAPRAPTLLCDPDADMRLLICEVVRHLPAAEATALMAALLDREGEANVCAAAIEVLAEVGDAAALPALERCAARFADVPFLVFSARMAARRIGDGRG
jgi:HEAT repeat protein